MTGQSNADKTTPHKTTPPTSMPFPTRHRPRRPLPRWPSNTRMDVSAFWPKRSASPRFSAKCSARSAPIFPYPHGRAGAGDRKHRAAARPRSLASLLNGSRFNFIIVGADNDPAKVKSVILTFRGASRNLAARHGRTPAPATETQPEPEPPVQENRQPQPEMQPQPQEGNGQPECAGGESAAAIAAESGRNSSGCE